MSSIPFFITLVNTSLGNKEDIDPDWNPVLAKSCCIKATCISIGIDLNDVSIAFLCLSDKSLVISVLI